MDQTRTSYYLVKYEVLNVTEDFAKMLGHLGNISELTVTSTAPQQVQIVHQNAKMPVEFSIAKFQMDSASPQHASMLLICDKVDEPVIELFRSIARKFEYRMFNTNLNCFMPQDPDLVDVNQLIPSEKISKVFRVKQLVPVFANRKTMTHYCEVTSDRSIHIVNPAMLTYFLSFDVDETLTPEFSYKVADNLQQFVALANADLIPVHFYEYYGRGQRIFNYSYFNIWHVTRKVFVKPYFHVFNPLKLSYEPFTSSNSALSFADKIRPGENLDTALTRIVRVELKLANDFFRAKVRWNMNFDRDKEGKLTPLLNVDVFLNQISTSQEVQAQANRGWVSLNKTAN